MGNSRFNFRLSDIDVDFDDDDDELEGVDLSASIFDFDNGGSDDNNDDNSSGDDGGDGDKPVVERRSKLPQMKLGSIVAPKKQDDLKTTEATETTETTEATKNTETTKDAKSVETVENIEKATPAKPASEPKTKTKQNTPPKTNTSTSTGGSDRQYKKPKPNVVIANENILTSDIYDEYKQYYNRNDLQKSKAKLKNPGPDPNPQQHIIKSDDGLLSNVVGPTKRQAVDDPHEPNIGKRVDQAKTFGKNLASHEANKTFRETFEPTLSKSDKTLDDKDFNEEKQQHLQPSSMFGFDEKAQKEYLQNIKKATGRTKNTEELEKLYGKKEIEAIRSTVAPKEQSSFEDVLKERFYENLVSNEIKEKERPFRRPKTQAKEKDFIEEGYSQSFNSTPVANTVIGRFIKEDSPLLSPSEELYPFELVKINEKGEIKNPTQLFDPQNEGSDLEYVPGTLNPYDISLQNLNYDKELVDFLLSETNPERKYDKKHVEKAVERKMGARQMAMYKHFGPTGRVFMDDPKVWQGLLDYTTARQKKYLDAIKEKQKKIYSKNLENSGNSDYMLEKPEKLTLSLYDRQTVEYLAKFRFASTDQIKLLFGNNTDETNWRMLKLFELGLAKPHTFPNVRPLWSATGLSKAIIPANIPVRNRIKVSPDNITHTLLIAHIAACLWAGTSDPLYLPERHKQKNRFTLSGERLYGETLMSESEILSSIAYLIRDYGKHVYKQALHDMKKEFQREWQENLKNYRKKTAAGKTKNKENLLYSGVKQKGLKGPEHLPGNEWMFVALAPVKDQHRAYHIPDLVVQRSRSIEGKGQNIAVEVERNYKPKTYEETMACYNESRDIYKTVVWVCSTKSIAKAVKEAAQKTGTYDMIQVRFLKNIEGVESKTNNIAF